MVPGAPPIVPARFLAVPGISRGHTNHVFDVVQFVDSSKTRLVWPLVMPGTARNRTGTVGGAPGALGAAQLGGSQYPQDP